MKPLRILVTGGGSPGVAGTIYSLRNNPDHRKVYIVTTDMRDSVVGKYLADKFYMVPPATSELYLTVIMEICADENIDVILPQNTAELSTLSWARDCLPVSVSSTSAIGIANNKRLLSSFAKELGIPVPRMHSVEGGDDFQDCLYDMGYYDGKTLVIKPTTGNGGRGVRILSAKADSNGWWDEKLTNVVSVASLNFTEDTPPMLVMEYLSGEEITVDCYRGGNGIVAIPRIRREIRSGISFDNVGIHDEEIIEYSKTLAEQLDMYGAFGFQFKRDSKGVPCLLECNPRIQGSMVFSTLAGCNVIWYAVKDLIGDTFDVKEPIWNYRMTRYWGAIGINKGTTDKII